jgi:hypothetical protein
VWNKQDVGVAALTAIVRTVQFAMEIVRDSADEALPK